METPGPYLPEPTTTHQITAIVRQLCEGDRVEVLKFCQSIKQCRDGKRAQRVRRLVKPTDNSWQIGR